MKVLMCPVCRQPLQQVQRTRSCKMGHSYDLAKQGYVNLHVVQHKHSKNPGDTEDSVRARRAFLSGGFYQPLRDALIQQLNQLQINTLLDIGCGEGYYTSAMQHEVKQCIGVDIAKTAVQRAAKLNPDVTWVVATGSALPVIDESVDLCSSIFSPLPKQEMQRVLKSNGYLLVVTPAPQHLYAMRQALFNEVTEHEPQKFIEQLQPEFVLIEQQHIQSHFILDQMQLDNLIAMTPYAYKAKLENKEQLKQQQNFELTAHFQLYLFQKT